MKGMDTAILASTLFLGVSALVALIAFFIRSRDPRRVFRKATRSQAAGKLDSAAASFRKVLVLLERCKMGAFEHKGLVRDTSLALGSLALAGGEGQEAFTMLQRAKSLGAQLANEAEFHLAKEYARQRAQTEQAIESYLCFLAKAPKAKQASEPILDVLRELARVAEDRDRAGRAEATALNRRILVADETIQWAHHFLGLSLLLDGRAGEARASLARSRALDPAFRPNGFWLSVCYLQLPEPDLEAAIKELEAFLAQPRGEHGDPVREAGVCRQIAASLANQAGGLDCQGPQDTQVSDSGSSRALKFFRLAAELQPDCAEGRYDLGRALQRAGNLAAAATEFAAAAAAAPDRSEYVQRLAITYRGLGRIEEAFQAGRKALDLAPGEPSVAGLLGELHFQIEDFEPAANYFLIALRRFPSQPLWLALRIRALFNLGEFAQVLEAADSLQPGNSNLDLDPIAVHAVGRSAMNLGHPLEAMAWLRTLDGMPMPRFHLACATAQSGDYAQAHQMFSELMGTAPELRNDAMLFRAHACFYMGQFEAAEKDYWQALEGNPQSWEAYGALGSMALAKQESGTALSLYQAALRINPMAHAIALSLGTAQEREGQPIEALRNLQAIPKQARERAAARLRMGILAFRSADYGKAMDYFLDSSLADADGDDYLFYRGATHAQLGQYSEALDRWHLLRQRHPANERLALNIARAHYLRGGKRLQEGNLPGAIEDWSQYLACYADDLDGKSDLAELHFQNGLARLNGYAAGDSLGASSAADSFRLAQAIDPGCPAYSFWLGAAQMAVGAPEEAAGQFQTVLERAGPDPRLHYHLGSALLQVGKRTEIALQHLEAAAGHPEAGVWSEFATWALANEKLRMGQVEEAADLFASTLDPGLVGDAAE